MKRIVRLTESDMVRLVNKVIKEQNQYPNHQGIKYLAEKLKPFGFQLDTEHFGGVPTVIKGDDRNGAAIQFYTKNGFYFQLVVTVNGKDVVLKKYPINEKDNYTSNKAVNQILIDLEKWKNYNFQKSKNLGEQSGIVNKVIKEQTGDRDPKRIAFFDGLAKQISSKIVGKTFPFGKIGVLDNTSIKIESYMDRNHAINRTQYPVNELNLFFKIRRVQEDLNQGEKPGTRVWRGGLQITANFINGKISPNPKVDLWGIRNGNIDFSMTAMTPSRPWTWDMVGGADLWSKAANPPNNLR